MDLELSAACFGRRLQRFLHHFELEKELKRTLADAARYINRTYDVEGLHSSFPERLEKLRKRCGDRLTEH